PRVVNTRATVRRISGSSSTTRTRGGSRSSSDEKSSDLRVASTTPSIFHRLRAPSPRRDRLFARPRPRSTRRPPPQELSAPTSLRTVRAPETRPRTAPAPVTGARHTSVGADGRVKIPLLLENAHAIAPVELRASERLVGPPQESILTADVS